MHTSKRTHMCPAAWPAWPCRLSPGHPEGDSVRRRGDLPSHRGCHLSSPKPLLGFLCLPHVSVLQTRHPESRQHGRAPRPQRTLDSSATFRGPGHFRPSELRVSRTNPPPGAQRQGRGPAWGGAAFVAQRGSGSGQGGWALMCRAGLRRPQGLRVHLPSAERSGRRGLGQGEPGRGQRRAGQDGVGAGAEGAWQLGRPGRTTPGMGSGTLRSKQTRA